MKLKYRLTEAELMMDKYDKGFVRVTHYGEEGNKLEDVIEDVRKIFSYSESFNFDIYDAVGEPNYLYTADFYIV